MSQFDELLASLKAEADEAQTLAKALPAEDGEDDEAIQAAAAESTEADDKNPEDDEVDDDAPIAKSVTAMVDGEEFEAIDATDLIKSLSGRIDAQEAVLAKALATTLETVKAQGEMIKSLNAEMKKLAGQGKGRKTVLSVVEKPAAGETMAKSAQQEGLTPADVMAKANAAFGAGKITGKELTTLDVALRNGQIGSFGDLLAKALS